MRLTGRVLRKSFFPCRVSTDPEHTPPSFNKALLQCQCSFQWTVEAHSLGSAAISTFQGTSLQRSPETTRSFQGVFEACPAHYRGDGPQFENFGIAHSTRRMTVDAALRSTRTYPVCRRSLYTTEHSRSQDAPPDEGRFIPPPEPESLPFEHGTQNEFGALGTVEVISGR